MWKIQKLMLNLLLLSCLVACSSRSNVASLLNDAEVCMNENPDSSLVLLDSIKHIGELSEEQNALWCLLHTIAMDKLSIAHVSDSLIQISVNYYADRDRADRKMQSYYYCGRVYQDLNDALQAQEYYLKAYDIGKNSNDYSLLGRLCANLGTLYTYQELYGPALAFQKKAVCYFEQVQDTVCLSHTFKNIARIHVCESQMDSAIIYYSNALEYTSDLHKLYMYNELADIYGRIGEYEKGLFYARDACGRIETVNDSCLVSLTLGDLFLKSGKLDSAFHYLSFSRKSTRLYTLKDTYYWLSQLEKTRGDWEACVFFKEQYEAFRDSIEKQTHIETLARMQNLYDYQLIEKEKNYYRQEAVRKTNKLYQLALLGVLLLLLVVCIILHLFRKRREKEAQLNQFLRFQEQEYLNSQKYLAERNATIAKLEQQIAVEKQKREENKVHYERELIQETNRANEKEQALEMVHTILAEKLTVPVDHFQEKIDFNHLFFTSDLYQGLYAEWKKLDESLWPEVVKMIDHVLYKDFTSKIRMLYPQISQLDLTICYLIKLDIPVGRIASFLSVRSQAISNKRKRLFEKLTNKKGTAQDFDEYIKKV